jgi:hypothetical protein
MKSERGGQGDKNGLQPGTVAIVGYVKFEHVVFL